MFQHGRQELTDVRVDADVALEIGVGHLRVHGVDERMYGFVGAGTQQRGAQNAFGILLDVDFQEAVRPAFLISASFMPTRPSGGSV